MNSKRSLRLAIPSSGALYEPTMMFLHSCGISVSRSSSRTYAANMPSLPGIEVMFQRMADISMTVEDGNADMGIVGYDRFLETIQEDGNSRVAIENLGFGHCDLVIGVPDSWIDVTSVADLSDLSMEFRETGAVLRIATKFPKLVERFLIKNGINYFSLAHSSGTLEAAPVMGYADIIADISSSGTTLRENRLKTIDGGTIITSDACLISNKASLRDNPFKLNLANQFVDIIDAYLQSRQYYSVTANMRAETPEEVAKCILDNPGISGLRGPTIAKVYTENEEDWFAVTVIVEKARLMETISHLRSIGSSSATVSQLYYVFQAESLARANLS